MGKVNINLGAMAGGGNALSALLPGDQAPSANPLYGATWDDESQAWQDQNGNTLPDEHQKTLNSAYDNSDDGNISHLTSNYYNSPSFTTKFFQPEVAKQENNLISQWNAQGPEAQHAEAVKEGINTGIINSTRPYFGQPVPTIPSKALGIMTQGNVTPQNIRSVMEAQSDVGNAIPQAESGVLKQKLDIEQQRNKALIAGDYGTVSAIDALTGAKAGTEQNVNTSLEAKANRPAIAPAGALRTRSIQAALDRQTMVEQASDAEVNKRLNDAVMSSALSEDDKAHFNQILTEHRNNQNFATMYSGLHPAPEAGLYNDTSGRKVLSPYASNFRGQLEAKLGTGGASGIPVGGGLNIVGTQEPTAPAGFVAPKRDLRTTPEPQQEETSPVKGTLQQQINQSPGSAAYSGGSGKGQSFGDMIGQLGKSIKPDISKYATTPSGAVAMYFKQGKGTVAIGKDEVDQFEQNADGSLKVDKQGLAIPKITSNTD